MNKKIISLILFLFLLLSGCEDEVTPPTKLEYGSLSGTVNDAETGEPIPGALVEALLSQVTDSTDNIGTFFLDSLLTGDENIKIISEFFESQLLEITITPDSQDVTVSMDHSLDNLYLYVGESEGHNLYIIDVDSREKIDSLYFSEGIISALTITPGGTKVYINDNDGRSVFYLDTKSRTFHSTNLPNGLLKFSPYDDQLFLFSEEGIFIVDTLSDVALQIDAIRLKGAPIFSPILPVIYTHARYSPIYVYDYQQQTIIDSLRIFTDEMEITPDGSEIYFFGVYYDSWDNNDGRLSGLLAWNLSAETLYKIDTSSGPTGEYTRLAFWNGQIDITPDSRYVLITERLESGFYNGNVDTSVPGIVSIINTGNHEFDFNINVGRSTGIHSNMEETVFTPSRRYAFVVGYRSVVFMLYVAKRKTLKVFEFGLPNGSILPMVIGSRN